MPTNDITDIVARHNITMHIRFAIREVESSDLNLSNKLFALWVRKMVSSTSLSSHRRKSRNNNSEI
ncbi:hypothetical protein BGX26_000950 [Mortierella sp. AD094]|nr:hypothetical protein BGX26_000950 [Mortierella sp. AD094]